METCVLIPQEFALAVTGSGARASKEPTVSVWSTNRIPQGSLCYPFQGTIRIDKLDVYSQLDESDVSDLFPSIFIVMDCKVFTGQLNTTTTIIAISKWNFSREKIFCCCWAAPIA